MSRKEAIEVIKKNYPHVTESGTQLEEALRTLVPELKESEDERIRKWCVNLIKTTCDYDSPTSRKEVDDAIAWLERQGEQQHFNDNFPSFDEAQGTIIVKKQSEQNPADRVEPQFKVGDVIQQIKPHNDNTPVRVVYIGNGSYTCESDDLKIRCSFPISEENEYKLVEQKLVDKVSLNFEKGDILYEQKTMSILLVYGRKGSWLMTFCDYWMPKEKLHVEFPYENYGFVREMSLVPATKEQRELLFQKIKEVGYEWDAERKELKKISQEYPLTPDECIKPAVFSEQDPAWSEEDEYCRHQLIVFCENCMVQDSGAKRCANWLKSIKERYTWKPSNEQMKALAIAIRCGIRLGTWEEEALKELIEQLKKLKG